MYPDEAKDTNVYTAEPEPTLIQRFEALNNHVASAAQKLSDTQALADILP